jgi:DNA polymerase-3 subunit alpha
MFIPVQHGLEVGQWVPATVEGDSLKLGTISIPLTSPLSLSDKRKYKAIAKKDGFDLVLWVDLHRHSAYSILDGETRIGEMVELTDVSGALTDHGNMFGALAYYKAMRKAGKLPILGFEAYSEDIDGKKEAHHLLLLAKNSAGFHSLTKLTSMAHDNFYRKPQINYEMLQAYHEGIIATSACLGGEVSQKILAGDVEGARKVVRFFQDLLKDDYYIEIQHHGLDEEQIVNPVLKELASEFGIQLVGTTDAHYARLEDKESHEVLLSIQTGKTMDDDNRWTFQGTGYHIHEAAEVEALFANEPEALDGTVEIAEKCAGMELDMGKIYMPQFPLPTGFNDDESFFRHLCRAGYRQRFQGKQQMKDPEYLERMTFEIDTILGMGFPGYFLIVHDFVNFAKSRGILVGPGRGSVCGSLVAYALGITEVNPIPYGLLFERFLNPDRISMPDIDLDFEDSRREEVLEYVREKYGHDAVSRIVTFGTMAARAVVRDVTRVMNKPYALGDKIAKTIPAEPEMTLEKAYNQSPEFKDLYDNDEEVRVIIDMAKKLEGLPKSNGQHACGIIIAPDAVTNHIPQLMMKNPKTGVKEPTTQFTMSEDEEMGLLKMDFLGLRTMGVVADAIRQIEQNRGTKLDFLSIPNDDIATYRLISEGHTAGVFQLESQGMTGFMKQLYQDIKDDPSMGRQYFERLVAGVSLYRPGPLDEIPHYLENMLDPSKISYETPQLKPILDATYGIIVYQEQVMFIVRELAGFSRGQADTIRKAMGKKIVEILNEYEEYFIYGSEKKGIKGCVANGIAESVAHSIWDKMKTFAKYAFNKSHAAGYSEISIRTAWLSNYYPTEYIAAILNSYVNKADKIKTYLSVAKKRGITVLAPNVNRSGEDFVADGNEIIFGLSGIRNVGKNAPAIIQEREANGPFTSFLDFAGRMGKHGTNRKVMESLIYAGAMDTFTGTRADKLAILDAVMAISTFKRVLTLLELDGWAKLAEVPFPQIPEMDELEKLEFEHEYAGFYVTGHPLDVYQPILDAHKVIDIGALIVEDEEIATNEEEEVMLGKREPQEQQVRIAGRIKELKTFYSKRDNNPIKVFQLEDRTSEAKVVFFGKKQKGNKKSKDPLAALEEGLVVVVEGTFKVDDFGGQVVGEKFINITELSEGYIEGKLPKMIAVHVVNGNEMDQVKDILDAHPGIVPLKTQKNNQLSEVGNVSISLLSFVQFKERLGERVKLVY